MQKTPVNISKIISKENFRKRFISYNDFVRKARDKNAIVIDIRDPVQREVQLPLNSRNVYLDKVRAKLIIGAWKDRELLIFDAVGKQVRWLQYYLDHHGYKNYYFLDKGVGGIKKVTVKK